MQKKHFADLLLEFIVNETQGSATTLTRTPNMHGITRTDFEVVEHKPISYKTLADLCTSFIREKGYMLDQKMSFPERGELFYRGVNSKVFKQLVFTKHVGNHPIKGCLLEYEVK